MNATQSCYYRQRLLQELGERQRKNASYSLRAFARALSLQPPSLSAILSGKRSLPKLQASVIAEKLGLSPAEKSRFLDSVNRRTPAMPDSDPAIEILSEERHFKIIAEWEHYAVLTLMDIKGFKPEPDWIAQRLGISAIRAKDVLTRLSQGGLITMKGSALIKTSPSVRTSEDTVSSALQQAHREELALGAIQMEKTSVDQRDYSSSTIALDPARLPEAKALIRDFRRKFAKLKGVDSSCEVYQICVQLYPLSRKSSPKGNRK